MWDDAKTVGVYTLAALLEGEIQLANFIELLLEKNGKKTKTLKLDPRQSLSKKDIQAALGQGYDLKLMAKMQPQGGIMFDERETIAGDGFSKTVYVTGYPSKTNPFWLAWVLTNQNTVATVDIKSTSNESELSAIDRALNELEDRAAKERKTTDRSKAGNDYQALLRYANDLNIAGEVAKLVRIRIYVYANTQDKLDERVSELRKVLKGYGYKTSTMLFQEEDNFRSLFMSYTQEDNNLLTSHRGHSMPAGVLGKGVPFHHQSLQDPLGYPIGTTDTDGTFIFDQFRYTSTRRSFNAVVLGKMGNGKSTFLKLMEEATQARGNYIRIIDKVKEYEHLVKSQGGLVINLDGSDGRINPWEVFATITDADGLVVNEQSSFAQTVTNITSQLRMKNHDFKDTDAMEIRQLIRMHYVTKGLISESFLVNGRQNGERITGLDPNDYPNYRTFLEFVKGMRTSGDYMQYNMHETVLDMLITTINDLLTGYGAMFDGPSTVKNLSGEPIVSYDISSIANMDNDIFQIQLASALQLIWSDALKNGRTQNYKLGKKQIEMRDVRYFNVIFDECHNLINANNPDAVEYVSNFEREMRKFRAGVILATQSPQEMLPEGASGAQVAKLKTIFELTQYKVLFGMDDSILGRMHDILGDSLNDSEYAAIPDQAFGHAIVSFGSKESYRVRFNATPRQLSDFKGQ